MSPEEQTRAFDPFYTTKDVGQGTGLGLSIVYGFLKQCLGHVSLSSKLDAGTEVKLYLPDYTEYPIETAVDHAGDYSLGKGELILVIEDDADVRELTVRLLVELGYCTIEAEKGKEALHLLQSSPSVALLLSDIVLPGGTSRVELAEEAWQKNPELKAVFVSGYAREYTQRFGEAGYELLAKPYTKSQLGRKINKALKS